MFPAFHTGGVFASLGANLLLWGAILANLPQPWCERGWCAFGRAPAEPRCCWEPPDPMPELWEPYVDNRGGRDRGPQCLVPRARDDEIRLLYGPLPDSFDPLAPRAEELFACVRLAPDGSVERVRLTGTSGRRGLDAQLVARIQARWQFTEPAGRRGTQWQRVRLSGLPRGIADLSLAEDPREAP